MRYKLTKDIMLGKTLVKAGSVISVISSLETKTASTVDMQSAVDAFVQYLVGDRTSAQGAFNTKLKKKEFTIPEGEDPTVAMNELSDKLYRVLYKNLES